MDREYNPTTINQPVSRYGRKYHRAMKERQLVAGLLLGFVAGLFWEAIRR